MGKAAGIFANHLDRLIPEFDGVRYEFLDVDRLSKVRAQQLNREYWLELLSRCHWVAAGAVVRTQRWLYGLSSAFNEKNLMMSAAAARGLIESSADAEYTLGIVPLTLAQHFVEISDAISGRSKHFLILRDLEERLIHFTHARKVSKSEGAPASHAALQVAQYRARLDTLNAAVPHVYCELCDLTHPGSMSVLCFAEPEASDAEVVSFSLKAEALYCEALRSRILQILDDVLMFGLNPAFVTLKLLNKFGLSRLNTPYANKMDLRDIPLWGKVRSELVARGLTMR